MTSKTVETSKTVDTAAIALAPPSSQVCNLSAFWCDTRGATSIEYAIIASGITVAIAAFGDRTASVSGRPSRRRCFRSFPTHRRAAPWPIRERAAFAGFHAPSILTATGCRTSRGCVRRDRKIFPRKSRPCATGSWGAGRGPGGTGRPSLIDPLGSWMSSVEYGNALVSAAAIWNRCP